MTPKRILHLLAGQETSPVPIACRSGSALVFNANFGQGLVMDMEEKQVLWPAVRGSRTRARAIARAGAVAVVGLEGWLFGDDGVVDTPAAGDPPDWGKQPNGFAVLG